MSADHTGYPDNLVDHAMKVVSDHLGSGHWSYPNRYLECLCGTWRRSLPRDEQEARRLIREHYAEWGWPRNVIGAP